MATNNQAVVALTTMGDSIVIPAPSANSVIQVLRVVLALSAQTTLQFKSGSSPLSGPMTLTKIVLDQDAPAAAPWYITGKGENFVISLGANVDCGGTLYYQVVGA